MADRNQTVDLLKGIAVILMIQVHIIALFATTTIFNSGIGKVLLFCGAAPVAPVFMIIFGYFIAKSKKSTIKLVIRGLNILFIGMFLNIALNLNLIISVNKGLYDIDIIPYIFGVDILHLAGLSIIIIALLKKVLERSTSVVIVFLIISAFLGNFLLDYTSKHAFLKYVFALFYGDYWWSYFPLFPWLSYPLAGIAFYKIKQYYNFLYQTEMSFRLFSSETEKGRMGGWEKGRFVSVSPFLRFILSFFVNLSSFGINSPKAKIILGVLFLLFFVFTFKYATGVSSDLPTYYHHGLIFFLWVILFLSFYSFFINETEKKFGTTMLVKYIKWLGKNVTIIYIIQWIIIGNTATEIYKTVSSSLYLLISFLTILFGSSFICYLWIKSNPRLKSWVTMKHNDYNRFSGFIDF